MKKKNADIEKTYTTSAFAAELRRLARALEKGERFAMMVAGQRVTVPAHAMFSVEYEREGKHEEIEFQLKWVNCKSSAER